MLSLQDAIVGAVAPIVVTTLCAAIAAIARFSWKGWQSFKTVSEIAKEFKPNGGSSFRDRLDKLQDTMDSIGTMNNVCLDLIQFPLLKADKDGHVFWVNRQFIHEAEVSETEVMGLGWLNLVADDHRETVKSQWLSAVEDARSLNVEFEVVHGCTATLVALPLISQKHGLIGMVGTLRFERTFTHG